MLTTKVQIENNFSISSEDELVDCFRPRDQKILQAPDSFSFPMNVRSYLTWKEPSGVYSYLVFKLPNWDQPRGVALKKSGQVGEGIGSMCSWCNSYGLSDEISMFTVAMNANESFSYLLCSSLSCVDKLEETAALSGRNPERGIADLYYKMGKLFERIRGYAAD